MKCKTVEQQDEDDGHHDHDHDNTTLNPSSQGSYSEMKIPSKCVCSTANAFVILNQNTTLNGESEECLKTHCYQGDIVSTRSSSTSSGNAIQSD